MSLETVAIESSGYALRSLGIPAPAIARKWYAVFTLPQNEKSTIRHLDLRGIESFLPTYETVRVWKNRQRVKTTLPLFQSYLFVRIQSPERAKVLQSPGVLQIVGNGKASVPLPDAEVELLRTGLSGQQFEPYRELVIGKKVRIKSGIMRGIQGTLVRKNTGFNFVLTLGLMNQHAAIHVDPKSLEPLPD
jgi:transcription antitermination factor NusG